MYGVSKLAECQYSRLLADELRPRRIAVTAVCPGGQHAGAAPAAPTLLLICRLHAPTACLSAPNRPLPLARTGWCSTGMSSFKGPRSAAEGADTPVWLAFLPEAEALELSGKFVKDRRAEPW